MFLGLLCSIRRSHENQRAKVHWLSPASRGGVVQGEDQIGADAWRGERAAEGHRHLGRVIVYRTPINQPSFL